MLRHTSGAGRPEHDQCRGARARRDEGDGPPDAGGVDRYHIVSPADLQDVARRLAGTFQGTSGVAEVDRSALTSENHSARL
jgi:hypothetical protein